MSQSLQIDYAVRSEQGDKPENADAADARVPEGELLLHKGVAAAIADGMSSSEGGREASETVVTGFLSDYYSTPESWSVRTSASRVLGAINRWLYGQGLARFDSARGMVTTFTGLVLKSTTAHLFHVGDSRLYRYREGELELLTRDHRIWVSRDREFLSRAMGADPHVEIDYRRLAVECGDLFLFTTDGITGFVTDNRLRELLREKGDTLPACVDAIVEEALANGSNDNVTCQLLEVRSLPTLSEEDLMQRLAELPFPPPLEPGVRIDGYEILRELHTSSRSEVFIARDMESGRQVVLKTPSINYRDDPAYLDAFLHEEWVGRRLDNAHVVKVLETPRRRFLYHIMERVEGQSLRQWISDHPHTPLERTREFVKQIAEGLRAFHRLEMLHLDLKPENIMIRPDGLLKIIDLGSVRVAGSEEIASSYRQQAPQGTVNYTAPECLEGRSSERSDIYSLGVIAYELLTGCLPYPDSDTPGRRRRLEYRSARHHLPELPDWVDGALRKATHPDPARRYESLSEFLYDLTHPNPELRDSRHQPLIERDPLGFWRGLSLLLGLGNLVLLYLLLAGP